MPAPAGLYLLANADFLPTIFAVQEAPGFSRSVELPLARC